MEERSFFYCGKSDHFVAQCQLCLKGRTPCQKTGCGWVTLRFCPAETSCFYLSNCVYSQSSSNFKLWLTLALNRASLTTIWYLSCLYPWNFLDSAVEAAGLGDQHLSCITHCTSPILLITSCNHREHI